MTTSLGMAFAPSAAPPAEIRALAKGRSAKPSAPFKTFRRKIGGKSRSLRSKRL
jgi:hypothetical protein